MNRKWKSSSSKAVKKKTFGRWYGFRLNAIWEYKVCESKNIIG